MMAIAVPFADDIGFDRGEIIGYASIVASSLLIFFGVRAYRDTVAGGVVAFGRAFRVGALIALVSSLCYVATWEVIYFGFMPDFVDKYQAHVMEKERASGATDAELAAKRAQLDRYAVLYRNPAINAAVTLIEPLPIGLVVAALSAAILRRRRESGGQAVAV
jgi:hypothetical protein